MSDLLGTEFRGATLARLASLGVAAFDEDDLSAAVVLAARTKASTGVSTSAALPELQAVAATTDAAIERAAAALAASPESEALRDEHDALRMRRQLLQRVIKLRRADAATAALRASGAAPSRGPLAADVLSALGRTSELAAGAAAGSSDGGGRTSALGADVEEGEVTEVRAPRQGGADVVAPAPRPRLVGAAPFASRRRRAEDRDAPAGGRQSGGPLHSSRAPTASDAAGAPAAERTTARSASARGAAPAASAGVAVFCPVCGRGLAANAAALPPETAEDVQRHVERCLERRARHGGARDDGGASAAAAAAAPGASRRAADGDNDDLFADEEASVYGDGDGSRTAAVSTAASPEAAGHNADGPTASRRARRRAAADARGDHALVSSGPALDPLTAAQLAAGDDIDVDVFAEDGSDIDVDSGADDAGARGAVVDLTERGRLSRADRSSLVVQDDWDDAAYAARQAAFEDDVADDAAAADGESSPASALSPDVVMTGGFRLPGRVAAGLLPYQLAGVRWMWELHRQNVGGILGDEMGLGKTVQVAALLAGLAHSGFLPTGRPVLVVCPATVIAHWVRELHAWWPPLRVVVLHESSPALRTRATTRRQVVATARARGDVLVTTYDALRTGGGAGTPLLATRWAYAVLDEGHRVRNPDAAVTVAARGLDTVHRLILTGAPIQNRLRELWALFDFVYPGRLGDLATFEASFAAPIAAGGWTHASALQVATAYQCALVLRDLISPYLLRRLKRDVNAHLPTKTEQVLFCRLTPAQRDAYLRILRSDEVAAVMEGRAQPFRAITQLRKVCDHPALLSAVAGAGGRGAAARRRHTGGAGLDDDADGDGGGDDDGGGGVWSALEAYEGGGGRAGARGGGGGIPASLIAGSGKMGVLSEILRLWHGEGHRALLFAQGRQMLGLLEAFVSARGYSHLRMDGTTPVRDRQALVDKFNEGDGAHGRPRVFVFLLTTRVGGVGINLTGADRVLIFSPDWNPSTDMQARERAWRLGQRRHVTVYRLVTAGTIEEKIYHRQIFKTALTQKVLAADGGGAGGGKRLFNYRDMRELFTLGDMTTTADAAASARGRGGGLGDAGGRGRNGTVRATETELLAPDGAIDLTGGDGDAPAAALRRRRRHGGGDSGSDSDAAGALEATGIVAGREAYVDPEGDGGGRGGASESSDVDAPLEVAAGRRSDDSDARRGAVAGDRHRRRGAAAPGGAQHAQQQASQTAVLQALFGQGDLAGAFSHDTVEGDSAGPRRAAPPAVRRALARDGATADDAAVVQRHAARAAREAMRTVGRTTTTVPPRPAASSAALLKKPRNANSGDGDFAVEAEASAGETKAERRARRAARKEARRERRRARRAARAEAESTDRVGIGAEGAAVAASSTSSGDALVAGSVGESSRTSDGRPSAAAGGGRGPSAVAGSKRLRADVASQVTAPRAPLRAGASAPPPATLPACGGGAIAAAVASAPSRRFGCVFNPATVEAFDAGVVHAAWRPRASAPVAAAAAAEMDDSAPSAFAASERWAAARRRHAYTGALGHDFLLPFAAAAVAFGVDGRGESAAATAAATAAAAPVDAGVSVLSDFPCRMVGCTVAPAAVESGCGPLAVSPPRAVLPSPVPPAPPAPPTAAGRNGAAPPRRVSARMAARGTTARGTVTAAPSSPNGASAGSGRRLGATAIGPAASPSRTTPPRWRTGDAAAAATIAAAIAATARPPAAPTGRTSALRGRAIVLPRRYVRPSLAALGIPVPRAPPPGDGSGGDHGSALRCTVHAPVTGVPSAALLERMLSRTLAAARVGRGAGGGS